MSNATRRILLPDISGSRSFEEIRAAVRKVSGKHGGDPDTASKDDKRICSDHTERAEKKAGASKGGKKRSN